VLRLRNEQRRNGYINYSEVVMIFSNQGKT